MIGTGWPTDIVQRVSMAGLRTGPRPHRVHPADAGRQLPYQATRRRRPDRRVMPLGRGAQTGLAETAPEVGHAASPPTSATRTPRATRSPGGALVRRHAAPAAGCSPQSCATSMMLVGRLTKGRRSAPGLLAGLEVLDVTTTGRRSGQRRTSHLIAAPYDGTLALLGTNFGQAVDAGVGAQPRGRPASDAHLPRRHARGGRPGRDARRGRGGLRAGGTLLPGLRPLPDSASASAGGSGSSSCSRPDPIGPGAVRCRSAARPGGPSRRGSWRRPAGRRRGGSCRRPSRG